MTEWCWGVDISVSSLAFAYASLAAPAVDVDTLSVKTPEKEGARLAYVLSHVRRHAYEARKDHPPAVVWVEQASGRFRAPQLVYVVGVVQAALYESLGVPVWSVPSSTWKKRTVGAGNATKAQVAAWLTGQAIDFDGQDQCDAACISMSGRAMLSAGSWDAAA